MLTILIIEDNPVQMSYCIDMIDAILQNCLILKAENAEMALYLMSENLVDVFFIDVELPGMNGFQLAEEIRKNPNYIITTIVFITGRHANQLDIHRKYHHYEYIEKPYTRNTFNQLVGPMLQKLYAQKKQKTSELFVKKNKLILIETNEETYLVNFDDILYVETEGRKLTLHTKHKIFTEMKAKIERFIMDVNSNDFMRCHKSYAINVNNIKSIKHISRRIWYAYFSENQNCYCQISETYHSEIFNKYLRVTEKRGKS